MKAAKSVLKKVADSGCDPHQSMNQSINQSINKSIKTFIQSINQSINQNLYSCTMTLRNWQLKGSYIGYIVTQIFRLK